MWEKRSSSSSFRRAWTPRSSLSRHANLTAIFNSKIPNCQETSCIFHLQLQENRGNFHSFLAEIPSWGRGYWARLSEIHAGSRRALRRTTRTQSDRWSCCQGSPVELSAEFDPQMEQFLAESPGRFRVVSVEIQDKCFSAALTKSATSPCPNPNRCKQILPSLEAARKQGQMSACFLLQFKASLEEYLRRA